MNLLLNMIASIMELSLAEDFGLWVTLETRNGELYANLNTGAKSDLHLVEREGEVIALARYGHTSRVSTVKDVAREVSDCAHGRDYHSCAWSRVLEHFDLSWN